MVFFFTAILSALLMVLDRKSNDLRDAAQKCYQKAHQHFRIRKSVLRRPWETIPHAEISHEGIWLYTLEFQKRHPCPEVVRFFFYYSYINILETTPPSFLYRELKCSPWISRYLSLSLSHSRVPIMVTGLVSLCQILIFDLDSNFTLISSPNQGGGRGKNND